MTALRALEVLMTHRLAGSEAQVYAALVLGHRVAEDLRDATGLPTIDQVYRAIRALRAKGLLTYTPGGRGQGISPYRDIKLLFPKVSS